MRNLEAKIMFGALHSLFDSGDFLPHAHCYLWIASLVRLHLFSDLTIGVSYVAISLTLAYLVYRAKNEIPFSWMFVSFGVFIIACGGTHFMEVWTLWTPLYWLSGGVKLVTAAASLLTAIVLPPLVPKTLDLIRAAKQTESMKAELEHRVIERTAQLNEANHKLAHLAAIVASSEDAIASIDLDCLIVSWNPAAERMFGYNEAEILRSPASILEPPDQPSEISDLMRRIQAGERIASFETARVRKDGEGLSVQITLSPVLGTAGELIGGSITARDISERKRAEREIQHLNHDLERRVLERTEALTAANAELEAFSYSVSHDLRAPLRQIAGFANILMEEHAGELSDESKRYMLKVKDGAHQMGELIDNLLNLSRIGRQQVARRPAALNQVVDDALESLKPDAAGRAIEWRLEKLGTCQCDAGLFKQVFVNLLSNAIKYSRGREPAVIEVGRTDVNGDAVIFVRDNGAGFDMQYASKLFGVFQRLHKAREFEGTGVGLAIVQRIVHKHGGRIWAEAELGKGAAFFFTIPGGPA